MSMTNWDKDELARQVIRMNDLGYNKTETIERLHKAYLWKKRTIAVYWRTFNEDKQVRQK